ncbi:hypothetical protein KUU78_31115 (plasmid) [Pseudomonas aeruginosa]|uniref:hypothetical protein n=1 Tax=Pseudomonadota TaxID=1224 RepID=UPI0015CE2597|nr:MULTISPECIES: hypothetical protein [Pseudomonadota]MBY9629190.1 hypothetical protein [Pseudomonas aeruginosa]MBY9844510.1 hypothetical protein [Pseudomonas aeruginosa]MCO8627551.1 hypothetical protein [Burkholderia multivorans]NYS16940.1 hypothetical protein [Achromobacter xylosoxidans]QZV20351.1 hypothetical protein ITG68_30680 [Pseudomonas aeruginosa]
MSNLVDCVQIRAMTAADAAAAMRTLVTKVDSQVGIGIWEGSITGKISGQNYDGNDGKHIAVFHDTSLVAPFGPHGDAESEACAALFCLAVKHADALGSLVEAAQAVLGAWEKGDLAGAVRGLSAALERVTE